MMHRDKMKPKYALEDYIYEMESRNVQPVTDAEDLDVYTQLQQKEKDLILAAELGKALLEKNEELSRQNERIAEEYSHKLELLEQDRHQLRRKLTTAQGEGEARVLELQADLRELAQTLQARENELRLAEREKAALVHELTEQNLRLAAQLKESSRNEEHLATQLQGMRDQCNLKRSSLQDHVSSLEVLRDEIHMLSEKKIEMERRLQSLLTERDGLSQALDDATDRIMVLEHQTREHEIQFQQAQRELEHLRLINGSLGDRLEALSSNSSSPATNGHRSLLNEMECDDNEGEAPLLGVKEPSLEELKTEVLAAYKQLRNICILLRSKRSESLSIESDSLPLEVVVLDKVKAGFLTDLIKEVSSLVQDLVHHRVSQTSSSSGLDSELELEVELHQAKEQIEKMQKQLSEKDDELKKKGEQVMDLTSKLSVREAELAGACEERDQARKDIDNTHLARDEVVRKAWEVRDGAVARKNHVEVELARTRIDVMQANSQLLEAIQQKVELSQQLEQWQMDMQALLDDQMKRKLTNLELRSQSNSSGYESGSSSSSSSGKKRSTSRRLFGLFPR